MISHYLQEHPKWNKIEHRIHFQKTGRVKPLIDIETVVSLISGTTTQNGLKIDCIVDNETGRKISDEDLPSQSFSVMNSWEMEL